MGSKVILPQFEDDEAMRASVDRLDHIQVSMDEDEPDSPDSSDPRESEVWVFDFEYHEGRKRYRGQFESTILNIKKKQKVAVLAAQYSGNTPLSALSSDVALLNQVLAHLEFALTKRPKWAQELRELTEEGIVYALYDKVMGHENTFFRRPAPPEGSASAS